ncbi:MAG: hypothetical protein INR65_12090, partial [Gluconacetobacter diazotrophicus]|nr:hypothetical protein [Gluconacetobacter diazotrophicus]
MPFAKTFWQPENVSDSIFFCVLFPVSPMSSDSDLPAAEPAPASVPDARRSEDGGMALVKAAVESANDAIIITEAQLGEMCDKFAQGLDAVL